MDEQARLIELTTDIVAAHVTNNKVAAADVGTLIGAVHAALAALGKASESSEDDKHVPAVSVRASVKHDHLVCLVCGAKQKMLRRHLRTAHDLTPEQYRRTYDLPPSYPMVARQYAERRASLARSIGLGTIGRSPRKSVEADNPPPAKPPRRRSRQA